MPNFAFTTQKALPPVPEDRVFKNTNFTRVDPDTPIYLGVTGLRFYDCNLTNCIIPADAVADTPQRQISFCSHEHPDWIAKGLNECPEVCQHVVSTDEIIIDGVTIDTIYTYQDTVL